MLAIGALGLTQRRGVSGHVENIVLYLERQADALGIGIQRAELGIAEPVATERRQLNTGSDQRPGFMDVHGFQLGNIEALAHGFEIDCLTARHAPRSGKHRQVLDHLQARASIVDHFRVVADDVKRKRLQRVAGENRGCFVELAVAGRATAPQVVVIHRRQIVMNQRIGMDNLDRAGGAVDFFQLDVKRRSSRVDQYWAHPLAGRQHGVTHRLVQANRIDSGRGQPVIERGVYSLLELFNKRLEDLVINLHQDLRRGRFAAGRFSQSIARPAVRRWRACPGRFWRA